MNNASKSAHFDVSIFTRSLWYIIQLAVTKITAVCMIGHLTLYYMYIANLKNGLQLV